MNLREAYASLGLAPLGEFQESTSGNSNIGATTWMLIEAALCVLEGDKEAILVGSELQYAADLAETCKSYIHQLDGGKKMSVRRHTKGKGARHWELCGGVLRWESHRTIRQFFVGLRRDDYRIFTDTEYHTMALQRRDGPFAEIRRLERNDDGSYSAYSTNNEYLLDLTEEGARQVADADPYRVSVVD
jgi:hypothetical protein